MRNKIRTGFLVSDTRVVIAMAAIVSSILFPAFSQAHAAGLLLKRNRVDRILVTTAYATDDSYDVQEDSNLVIAAPGVLANDYDSAGNPLAAVQVSNPSDGSLTFNADGSFDYEPNLGFLGYDTFTYQAHDTVEPSVVTNVATVTITTSNFSYVSNTDGITPRAGLTLGAGGNLYGVDSAGGANGDGTVFRVTPGGVITTIHAFHGTDGRDPQSQLVLGADGNLYGTTLQGGPAGQGTIFRVTPSGAFTTLYPYGGSDLTVGSDGDLYGTTERGGAYNAGSIFKIGLDGSGYSTLYSFTGFGSDGGWPLAGLTLANDGNFYGTTTQYGDSVTGGTGTIFQFTQLGALTTLHSFNGIDGCAVRGKLVQGSDGNLYGTSGVAGDLDGFAGHGSLFKMTTAGDFTTLHNFDDIIGQFPIAGLMLGSDNSLYGVASYGGTLNEGTVFRLGEDGVLSIVYSFDGSDGYDPWGSVTQGADGDLYGTTVFGGTGIFLGGGTVYRLKLGLPVPAPTVAPFAVNQSYTATTNENLVVAAPGVLANDRDIYGDPLTAVTVSNPSHGTLTLNADGSFTYTPEANYSGPDTFTYQAKDSTHPALVSNTATVTLTVFAGTPVTIVTPASASPNPLFGTTTAVSALGGYTGEGGASSLTYTWSSTGPAAVTFANNGTNAAANTTATFVQSGSYTFTVTIADPSAASITSSVGVVVNPTTTSITVSPGPTLTLGPPLPASQQFTATAYDQFGNVESPQPVLGWKLSSGSAGSIDASGLYHTGHTSGTATVIAKTTNGVVSGSCVVTVN